MTQAGDRGPKRSSRSGSPNNRLASAPPNPPQKLQSPRLRIRGPPCLNGRLDDNQVHIENSGEKRVRKHEQLGHLRASAPPNPQRKLQSPRLRIRGPPCLNSRLDGNQVDIENAGEKSVRKHKKLGNYLQKIGSDEPYGSVKGCVRHPVYVIGGQQDRPLFQCGRPPTTHTDTFS